MQLIIALSGLLSVAGLLGSLTGSFTGLPAYVAVAGLLMTAATYLSRGVGPFLRFFIVFYALGFIGLAGW
jgi:vitamin B12/bleomycin/antimicrobial peptide transport system ATP-binding/permease protein